MLRKVFEKIKEPKWGTSYKSIWIKHPWNTIHIPYIIADSGKWSYGKWMHLGRNITHEFLLSQLLGVLSSFKCTPMMICLKKMFNGELIGMSFKKETEKIVLLEVKGLIHIDVKFRTKIDFWKKYYAMAYAFLRHGGALMYQESQQTRHTKKLFTRVSNSFSP